ncbi:MAG: alpha/beta hydrolase [Planctomycetia bacterium]|nr:alpha/beta hydrolase [Planctomycetia bacterium]
MKALKLILTVVLTVLIGGSAVFAAETGGTGGYKARQFNGLVYKKTDGKELKLNIHLPEKDGKTGKNLPVLIFISSGCWNSGVPGGGGFWTKFHGIERGFAVVNVGHRSLKEGTIFPAQVEDVKAAVRFLRANAKKYHLDPERFAVMGISSGGHLSLMLGIPNNYRQFDVGDHLDQSSQVQRVICFYSLTDFPLHMPNLIKSKSCFMEVCGCTKKENGDWEITPQALDRAKLCSPINYVEKDYAPTLLLHGVKDGVPISQSCIMYEKLKRSGVRTELFISNEGVHKYNTIAPDEVLEKMFFDFIQWNPQISD